MLFTLSVHQIGTKTFGTEQSLHKNTDTHSNRKLINVKYVSIDIFYNYHICAGFEQNSTSGVQ